MGGAVPDALRLHRLWYQPRIFRYRLGNVVLDDIHRPSHSHRKYRHLLLRTVDSRLLGRSSTRLQLNWVLLEQKSVIRFTTCTHYVPILMWMAHPVCSLHLWDRVVNYYCKSGSHFHLVSFFFAANSMSFVLTVIFKFLRLFNQWSSRTVRSWLYLYKLSCFEIIWYSKNYVK